ncbi:MAG: YceI family protein [Flavobacteriales bacterium]|nr:YceI family protein [Flavobacteriales bacterium]
MNIKHITGILLTASLLASCGGGAEKTDSAAQDTATVEAQEKTCTYTYTDSPVEVLWVAYKYTQKTGVKGVFEEVSVTSGGKGSPAEALQGASIKINTASSNSGDIARDPKIDASFFGKLENGAELSGVITAAEGDDLAGTVNVDVTMNGMTMPVSGTYEVKDAQVELKLELNVETWSAGEALASLNEVCEDLHKGPDGTSVLWPDVTVFVTTTLNKECN